MTDPSSLPSQLTDRIAFLMQLAVARVQALGEGALADAGISGREYGVLAMLQDGGSAQRRLGETLGIDRTTTMELLAGLERRGLVRRDRDPDDRRAYRIVLTPQGESIRARCAAILVDCEDRFLAGLSDRDRTRLRTMLLALTTSDPRP